MKRFLLTTFLAISLALGATDTRTSMLVVRIEPAALMTVSSSTVFLRARFSPNGSGFVWASDKCVDPNQSAQKFSASGEYRIPVASLGQGQYVCFSSTDGIVISSDFTLIQCIPDIAIPANPKRS